MKSVMNERCEMIEAESKRTKKIKRRRKQKRDNNYIKIKGETNDKRQEVREKKKEVEEKFD